MTIIDGRDIKWEKQLEDDINFWVTIRCYKEVNVIENMKCGKFKAVEF